MFNVADKHARLHVFFFLFFCRFYFDFSMTFVGSGMICSHQVNLSLLFGAVLSCGLMWPLMDRLKGDWFLDTLAESSMQGLYGYKVGFSLIYILHLRYVPDQYIYIYIITKLNTKFTVFTYTQLSFCNFV